jgi:serine/threonine protein phosphatase PrpC
VSEPCASCGQPLEETESFCEACGTSRGTVAREAVAAPESAGGAAAAAVLDITGMPVALEASLLASASGPPTPTPLLESGAPCAHCGAAPSEITPDGYCGQCGMKQPAWTDHLETDLGAAAAVSDRGHRHHRNEDAYELATRGDVTVAVVCDGVSNSSVPDQASAAAASAALKALEPAFGVAIDAPARAALLQAAVARAQEAVVALVVPDDPQTPATTLVAAIVAPGSVTAASVGDSRAYWLGTSEQGGQALTVDDSAAEEAITAGMSVTDAYARPEAHAITRWLGADAGEVRPNLITAAIPHPGLVLLCSDGLWNHYLEPAQLIGLVEDGEDRTPIAIARRMVAAALDAGGEDNITVAVLNAVPAPPTIEPEESFADADVHA